MLTTESELREIVARITPAVAQIIAQKDNAGIRLDFKGGKFADARLTDLKL